MNCVTLKAGNSIVTLAPGVGGGIERLILAGQEIFRRRRPGPRSRADPLDLGEFPMAPWVNRIAKGRFFWRGREISVADGPGDDPLGLHGVCWRMPWSVLGGSDNETILGMAWDGGKGWPFPFSFERRFSLTSTQLAIEATLKNLGPEPMPAAMGFHPYFPAGAAVVRAATSAAWVTDASGLPMSAGLEGVAARLRSGLSIEHEPLDNCFIGWDGVAIIDWPTHSLTVRTEPALRHLQIYSPIETGYFCIEPQSAMPDALNCDSPASGLKVLEGGARHIVTLRLEIAPPADRATG